MAEDKSRNLKEMSEVDSVRLRVGNTFGTNDVDGEIHSISEVIMNSCDEAKEGHGRRIEITIERDNTTTVVDEGRGIPMDWNEELGKYNWETAFCKLYGSGKYDSAQYSRSAGLNGLGLTATQYASEFMQAKSVYNGKAHYVEFRKGYPVGDMRVEEDNSGKTGTTIRFKPDPEVFIGADQTIPANAFNDMLRRQAMLIPGLKIILNHCDYEKPVVMHYDGGITEYVDEATEGKLISTTPFYTDSAVGYDDEKINNEPYEVNMRVAFNFSRNGGIVEVYHNTAHMFEVQQNKTLDALKRGFIKSYESYAKECNKLQKNDKFIFNDIEPLLTCVAETECPGYRTFFKNQTKGAIINPFIAKEFEGFIQRSVRAWIEQNKRVADRVLNDILALKKAREEADKVSKKAISEITKNVTAFDKPDGLWDCSSKNSDETEIYIVEGLSALTSVVTARDDSFQAAIALTGKPLNCLKASLTDIIKNRVIKNLYRSLQCGIEEKSRYIKDLPKFDMSKLRYGKIIICADADIDGRHIIILLLGMFYRLSPQLLIQGKVYIAESPLYELSYKDKSVFAYSDEERDNLLKEFESKGINKERVKIQRSKGLGENTAEMMAETTMNPETRRLIRVKYPEGQKEEEFLSQICNAMLGDDIAGRRVLIDEFFKQTADITD